MSFQYPGDEVDLRTMSPEFALRNGFINENDPRLSRLQDETESYSQDATSQQMESVKQEIEGIKAQNQLLLETLNKMVNPMNLNQAPTAPTQSRALEELSDIWDVNSYQVKGETPPMRPESTYIAEQLPQPNPSRLAEQRIARQNPTPAPAPQIDPAQEIIDALCSICEFELTVFNIYQYYLTVLPGILGRTINIELSGYADKFLSAYKDAASYLIARNHRHDVPLSISDEVVQQVIQVSSNNPNVFIQTCNHLLKINHAGSQLYAILLAVAEQDDIAVATWAKRRIEELTRTSVAIFNLSE